MINDNTYYIIVIKYHYMIDVIALHSNIVIKMIFNCDYKIKDFSQLSEGYGDRQGDV